MHEKNHSLIIVFYFFIALFCAIFFVIGFKFIKLWNTASFDGTHQFVLGTRGHDPTEVLIFRPDTQNIDVLLFKGESDALHLFNSAGVFVDAVVPYNSLLSPEDFHIKQYFRQQIFNTQNASLNTIDFLRLWLLQKSIAQKVEKKTIFTLPVSQSANSLLSQALNDKVLYQEGKTIAVVNASTFYGEGGNVATALIAIGANVISVTTATNQEDKSYISFSGDSSYTLLRVSRVTHIPITSLQKTSRLADINIVLGKDIKSKLP